MRLTARSAYENLMLEDFFPAGMEVVQKPEEFIRAWCGWWYRGYDHQEARDDRMVYFLDRVHEGERTFSYILRAETPGTFIALPARSELIKQVGNTRPGQGQALLSSRSTMGAAERFHGRQGPGDSHP